MSTFVYVFFISFKTWADLKSRTKRKVASNNKSLRETGGGLYRFANLTELEEIIDRTLLLSSAAAPSGKTFAFANDESSKWVNDAMESILETPPRTSKAMAVVTPTRITKAKEKEAITDPQPTIKEPNVRRTTYAHTFDDDSNAEEPSCSTKKRKTSSSEQVLLIRRQLRVAEQHAKSAKEQAEALTRLAAAAVSQAESAKKSSLTAESQAESAKKISESIERIEIKIDNFIFSQKN